MPTWLDTTFDIINRLNTYRGNLPSTSGQTYSNVKIDTMPVPLSSRNFLTLEQFNSIEYDSQHLWIVRIAGSPAPFNTWFPAQSIEEKIKGASVTSMSFGIDEINMLNGYNAITMRCEMLDDENSTLETWLKAWQKAISTDPITKKPYYGFRYLEDILTTMTVLKYSWQKEKISSNDYYVLPVGDTQLNRNNEPGLKILTVNFAVFGQGDPLKGINKIGHIVKMVQ